MLFSMQINLIKETFLTTKTTLPLVMLLERLHCICNPVSHVHLDAFYSPVHQTHLGFISSGQGHHLVIMFMLTLVIISKALLLILI